MPWRRPRAPADPGPRPQWIGRVRAARLEDEIGPAGVGLLRAIKRALDPEDLLNPGALLPPA